MKYFGILIVTTLFLISSCDLFRPDNPAKNNDLLLDYQECMEVDDNLDVCFVQIVSDSRCPENVVCVWEGMAEIEIKATWASGAVQNFILTERAGHPELADTTIGEYYFLLKKVNPYPTEPVQIDSSEYSIDLLVQKN